MQFKEYGTTDKQTILLLHGGGLSWWNYRAEAEMLKSDYHVVLPILDGHAESDRAFTTIQDNASEILSFIDDTLGGSVLAIGGLSLGGQILLEMLSLRKELCSYALVESAAVIPSKLTNALLGPAMESSYGLIQKRSFAKLQFRSLHMDDHFFEEYYRDTCNITKADMTAFLKASTSYSLNESLADTAAKVHVLAGQKETRAIKQSADRIKKLLPACTSCLVPGLYHGEFSLNHPDRYVDYLKKMIKSQ